MINDNSKKKPENVNINNKKKEDKFHFANN